MHKWIAATLVVLAAVSLPFRTSVAVAQAPDAQGWWWKYTEPELPVDPRGVSPVPLPTPPTVPAPPDAPADGLYVAGGGTEPEAISALSWVIPEGANATTLTLTAAAALTPTSTILLCPTNIPWKPVQAGRWQAKPLYQCPPDAPVGVIPTDGSKITFTLGKLGLSQLIDVALVPAAQTVFRAGFAKPDAKALTVILGATADASAGGSGDAVLGTSSGPGSLGAAMADPAYIPQLEPYLAPPPEPALGAAPLIQYPQQTAAAPTNASSTGGARDTLQTVAMFGLLALAALFNRFRGEAEREPRSLVKFGKHHDEGVS
jgi:hypothetical protein